MYIYKIINQVNNKIYIGQTIRPIRDRFKRHISDAENHIIDTHFARAIRKYGKDNFHIELLDTAINQEELNLKEQYWIRYFDSIHNGYNETDAVYKCGGNTYMSKSKKEMDLISNKIKQTKLKGLNPNARCVKCFNVKTNEELHFNSFKECQEYFGEKTHRFITTRVSFETKSLYKQQWKIAYANESYHDFVEFVNKSGTHLKIKNTFTGVERIYESIRLASRITNISRYKIEKNMKDGLKDFTINQYEITILN